jgi:hypothetical protein
MLIRCLAVAGVFSSQAAIAMTLTLEPDDFASGTNLSSMAFSYLSLSTTSGAPVYSAPIAFTGEELPAGISDTGPFQQQVFSADPEGNSEWWAWPEYNGISVDPYYPAEWATEPVVLLISFKKPVNYVSLLGLELGDMENDPIRWLVYDWSDTLIFSSTLDYMPGAGSIGFNPSTGSNYTYWDMYFSHPDIGRVIIGGESQPTTLDRLVFNVAPVPEPGTIVLLALGLVVLPLACRRHVKKSRRIA